MPIVDVKSISHVALKTRNVEQQTHFYTQMVGLGAGSEAFLPHGRTRVGFTPYSPVGR